MATTKNYGLITSIDELTTFTERLAGGSGPVAFDIETGYHGPDREKFSIHPETAIVVGISFTDDTSWARYVPLGHDDYDNLDNREVAELLWPILSSERGVPHNASFELRHLARWFRQHLGTDRVSDGYFTVRSDTQIEAYLAAEYESFGLKTLVKKVFDHDMIELYELFPDLPVNKRKYLRFNILDPTDPKVVEYACEDSAWTLALHERYHQRVAGMPLYAVEMAVVQECITAMEDHGVVYAWDDMRRAAEELRLFRDKYNAEIMAELSELLDRPVAINLASAAQVGKLLFDELGLRTSVYTAGTRDKARGERKMSTGKVALAGLAKQHPVVQKIRNWKEQTRLLSTYLEAYERKYSWSDDGRAHPNHLSAVVITGRFAVADPPYQQSPKKYHFDLAEGAVAHEEDREPPPGTCFRFNFRDMITAPPEHYIIGFDLSQAELRAIAGYAEEPELLKAFAEGRDVHTLTASLMLGVPLDQVTPKQRDVGKTLGFALLYGMSPKGLADRLGIDIEEAEELFAAYFKVFSRIKAWVDKQIDYGHRHGHVVSKFGRRLPIWEYQSDKRYIQQKGDRACVNYPVQGSATGDFMKIAMVRAVRALRNAGLHDRVHLVMNVHDALEFYVHRSVAPEQVIEVLQPAVIFPVPGWPTMKADWHVGRRWGSPIELNVDADGQIIVDAGREADLKPGIEVDDDTGEEVEIMPDLDTTDLRSTLDGEGRTVVVTIDAMPSDDGFMRFLHLARTTPGRNRLILVTPEGDVELPVRTGLGFSDTAQISLLLGPAGVVYDDTGHLDDLAEGLTL